MPVKQSQASSNLYFDVKVQTANQESKIVKVMHQKGDGCKRHNFVDKMNAQQPVKISNLSVTASGTMFFNKGAGIQDLPSHTITFQYEVQDPFEVTMVNSLMKSTTGNFNVRGSIKWKGEAHIPSEKTTQFVRDATLTDTSGSIPLSIWGEHITAVEEGNFYTFTECKLWHFYGKCLTTTKSTTVSAAEEQDLTKVKQQEVQNWICCPEILNVAVSPFLTCNNKDCKKKITSPPGSNIAKCLNCNRSMLIKNCYVDMTVSLNLEKDGKVFPVTAFPKVVSAFLQEDIFNYREDTEPLIEKLLLLDSVDFQLSQNGKLVAKMQDHEQSSDSSDNK